MELTKKDDTSRVAVNGVILHAAEFELIGFTRGSSELKLLFKNKENDKFYTVSFGKRKWQKKGLQEAFADAYQTSFRFDERPAKPISVQLLVDAYGCPHLDSEAALSGIGAISNAAFKYSQRGDDKNLDGSFELAF